MRNMKPYDLKEAFEVYRDAVSRKQDGPEKTELDNLEAPIKDCYLNYERHFKQNDLEYMPKARVGIEHRDVLLGLFGSQTKLVKDFRKRYFEINPQTYNNLCPYCVINSSGTTEHILPKEKYPEYAVNVLNLIPGCGDCNWTKGEKVLDDDGNKLIINFYTDVLPDVQFLFVDITEKAGMLRFEYKLSNEGNLINTELFALIERHFDKLHLLKRYDEKAIQEMAEIKNTYRAEDFENEDQYDVFSKKQVKKCDLDVPEYGRNHWKVVLLRACAESAVFKQFIMSK